MNRSSSVWNDYQLLLEKCPLCYMWLLLLIIQTFSVSVSVSFIDASEWCRMAKINIGWKIWTQTHWAVGGGGWGRAGLKLLAQFWTFCLKFRKSGKRGKKKALFTSSFISSSGFSLSAIECQGILHYLLFNIITEWVQGGVPVQLQSRDWPCVTAPLFQLQLHHSICSLLLLYIINPSVWFIT